MKGVTRSGAKTTFRCHHPRIGLRSRHPAGVQLEGLGFALSRAPADPHSEYCGKQQPRTYRQGLLAVLVSLPCRAGIEPSEVGGSSTTSASTRSDRPWRRLGSASLPRLNPPPPTMSRTPCTEGEPLVKGRGVQVGPGYSSPVASGTGGISGDRVAFSKTETMDLPVADLLGTTPLTPDLAHESRVALIGPWAPRRHPPLAPESLR